MTAPRFDMDELKALLRQRVPQMVEDCLPAARRAGDGWIVGSVYGDAGKSTKIWANGGYRDFNTDDKGDVLSLYAVLYTNAPVVNSLVIQSAAGFVGLAPEQQVMTQAEREAREKLRAHNRAAREKADAEKVEKTRRWWFSRWMKSEKCRPDDPVWSYLRAERGLDPAAFMVGGKLPGAIRYEPLWPFWERQQKQPTHHLPAMVTQMVGPLDPVIHGPGTYGCRAVHVTFLEQSPDRGWHAKKTVDASGRSRTCRRVFGSPGGALLPLWKGGKTTAFTKANKDATLVICEGVEDGLSLALVWPEAYVAAAYSITNLCKLRSPAPEGFAEVVLAGDNDWNNPQCMKQLTRMRDRIILGNRRCRIVFAKEGKDFNDWLRASSTTKTNTTEAVPAG